MTTMQMAIRTAKLRHGNRLNAIEQKTQKIKALDRALDSLYRKGGLVATIKIEKIETIKHQIEKAMA